MVRQTRRRYLAALSASVAGAAAGCTGLLNQDDGDDEAPDLSAQRIDDWQFDPDDLDGSDTGGAGGAGMSASSGTTGGAADGGYAMQESAAAPGDGDDLGLAVGGADDVTTFRRNIEEGYLPPPGNLSYEGLFAEYHFDTGDTECDQLFCPTYSPAVSPDPLSDDRREYLAVGLDSSLTTADFERPDLDLVVVLDISGSMDGAFDGYYYDRFGERREPEGDTDELKIDVAGEALAALTEQLRPTDRLGVVLYNNDSYLAKPVRPVGDTDMEAIREHAREDIVADGGTNTEAGIDHATELLAEYTDAAPADREVRTILVTDAMPNIGDTTTRGLRGTLEANADAGHYTTVVGVGLDFNTELIDNISSIRGGNYVGVNSADEFRERMGERFRYMVSPVVFDLSLELSAGNYDIARVYGTDANEATGEIMQVNSLFPSPTEGGDTRGGVILVELEPTDGGGQSVSLSAEWETRAGDQRTATEPISMPTVEEGYDTPGVRTAIVLSRYGSALRNWIAHERGDESVEATDTIEPPEPGRELGRWEQQSVPLSVTSPYDQRLSTLRSYVDAEDQALSERDLSQETETLEQILDAA